MSRAATTPSTITSITYPKIFTRTKKNPLKRAVASAHHSFASFIRQLSPMRHRTSSISAHHTAKLMNSTSAELHCLQKERNDLWIQNVALRTVALQEAARIAELANQVATLTTRLAELQKREATEHTRMNEIEKRLLGQIQQQTATISDLEELLTQSVLPLPPTPVPKQGLFANTASLPSVSSYLEIPEAINHTTKAKGVSESTASLPSITSDIEAYSEESTLTAVDVTPKVPPSPTNVTEWLGICTKLNDLPLLPHVPSPKPGMQSVVSYASLLNIASARNMTWSVVEGEPMGLAV